MAPVNPPSFVQNVATEQANSGRRLIQALCPIPGIIGALDLKSVQHAGTPGMSIDIPGGDIVIAGVESGVQGYYHCWSDSTVYTPSVAASDPTNPRIDRIVAKVRDQFYSTAFNQWDLAVVTGIAKAVPLLSDALLPNNGFTLGSILVTAAKTSILNADITDLRTRANAQGGVFATQSASVLTAELTSSATYVDLATVGPSVTLNTGSTVLVHIAGMLLNTLGNNLSFIGIAVSGATTIAANDTQAIQYQSYANSAFGQHGMTFTITGLTPGSNTFTLKYRASGGTSTFTNRRLTVTPTA
jgi:hypothetical protein